MDKQDFYEVLGVKKGADEKEIKRAYHRLAKKYHPDTNQGDRECEKKFLEVSEAYEILADPEKKKLYDTYGMEAYRVNFDKDYLERRSRFSGTEASGNSADFEDFFRNMSGGTFHRRRSGGGYSGFSPFGFGGTADFDSVFSDFGDREEQYGPQESHAEITVSFEEAAKGCDKVFQLSDGRKMQVHIPAGIDEGQVVRLKDRTIHLMLHVHIEPNALFERKGMDVYTVYQIPFTTAALGGKAIFNTLYGPVECSIPAGTQSGSRIRLKNKGIVSMKNARLRGDEYVTVQIAVPKSMTPDEREAVINLMKAEQRAG